MPTLPKSKRPNWLPKKESKPYTSATFYHSVAWRALRGKYIKENPLCAECKRLGVITPGTVIDHIVPIRKGGAALDERNLQTLCTRHHAIKTGKEQHG